MTFAHFWAILTKQWKLIVICFVVTGAGAYGGSKLLTPIYQSSVLIEVSISSQGNSQSDYTSLLASDQLVQTEAQLATSNPVLGEVSSHYPSLTLDQLSKMATSTVKLNTQLFEIDVTDPNPAQAAKIANDIAATLIKQELQRTQDEHNRSQQQMQQELTSTQKQIDAVTANIVTLQGQTGKQGQLTVLQTQLQGLQQHYNQWQTALAQLQLLQAQNANFLRIVQPAQPATKPSQPNVPLNTGAGLGAGLLLGMLLAIAFTQLDTRIRNAEAVGELLNWSILATIWRRPAAQQDRLLNPAVQDSNNEAFRILRANIGFSSLDKPLRSLMVTSAQPGEGKSTVAANLACFMAMAGRRTLLIDADLHRPTLHKLFNLSADKMGLTNAMLAMSMRNSPGLNGKSQFEVPPLVLGMDGARSSNGMGWLEPSVHPVGLANLWVMPSGPLPPNPAELLESKSMQRFFADIAKAGFELVVFDTPPLLGLADSSILASRVDGTLVVVDMTRANRAKLNQVKSILTQAGAQVLGCVLNKQRREKKDSAYSYYYYYRTVEQDAAPGQHGKKAEGAVASLNGAAQHHNSSDTRKQR